MPGIADPVGSPPVQSVSVSIADQTWPEGNVRVARQRDARGLRSFAFKVSVSPESVAPITLYYRVLDHTARCSEGDYQGTAGTITIPARVASSEIGVTVFSDDDYEADETFQIYVTSMCPTAHIAGGVAIGTISNDDFRGGGGTRQDPEALAAQIEDLSFALASANPVRGLPSFSFALSHPAQVSIAIYDLQGRLVGRPIEGSYGAGKHVETWNQSQASPGVYLARLSTEGRTMTQRIAWME